MNSRIKRAVFQPPMFRSSSGNLRGSALIRSVTPGKFDYGRRGVACGKIVIYHLKCALENKQIADTIAELAETYLFCEKINRNVEDMKFWVWTEEDGGLIIVFC